MTPCCAAFVMFCPECNYNLVAVRTPYTDCACLVTKTRKLATRVNIRWSWLQGCLEVYKSMTLVKRTGTNICKGSQGYWSGEH